MELVQSINYFLWVMVCAVTGYSVWLIAHNTPPSKQRSYVIALLSFWFIVSLAVYITMAVQGQGSVLYFNKGVLNMGVITLGVPCFFLTAGFLLTSLHTTMLQFKKQVKFFSPLIVIYLLYFIYHYFADINPWGFYPSLQYVFENIGSVSVILRIILLIIFWVYIIAVLTHIWAVVPKYIKFTENNLSGSSYNLDWLRQFVVHLSILSCTYTLLLLTDSIYANTVYIISLLAMFVFFVEKLLFTHACEELEDLSVSWSLRTGWVFNTDEVCSPKDIDCADYFNKLNEWMEISKEYTKINFTTNDIMANFPELTQGDISKILKIEGETFHSYVRKRRVNLACRTIEGSADSTVLKLLSNKVGFSHYSSFSRAFINEKGLSPSDYLEQQKSKLTVEQ